MPSKKLFVILLAAILPACASLKPAAPEVRFEKSSCNLQNTVYDPNLEPPKPIHEIHIDQTLATRLSFQSLNIANAIGILDLLTNYVNYLTLRNKNPTIENRLAAIEISQSINQRINTSSLEISAIASELDCEEERAEQIANYLKSKEGKLERNLTVAAIMAGAAGAIATGLMLSQGIKGHSAEYVGIATGITEATLGMSILGNETEVEFYHPRNALREFWEGGATSTIFPPPVWYYLNYQNPSEPQATSLRQKILNQWIKFKQIVDTGTEEKIKLKQLYFGNGGIYTAEQLINRANMHDQIESYINLMKQDLKQLAIELESINEQLE